VAKRAAREQIAGGAGGWRIAHPEQHGKIDSNKNSNKRYVPDGERSERKLG